MNNVFRSKPVINRRNGQVNLSIPKKQLSENVRKLIMAGKPIDLEILDRRKK